VVPADDEVGCAVVAPDDRVPDRLARARHAHRERQQAQDRAAGIVVPVDQRLVRADARVVVDVPRLGQPDDRMNEQCPADLLGGPLG
jgi:hypothetical protein